MFFAPVTSYVGVGDGNFVGSGLLMVYGYLYLKSRFAMFLIVVFS